MGKHSGALARSERLKGGWRRKSRGYIPKSTERPNQRLQVNTTTLSFKNNVPPAIWTAGPSSCSVCPSHPRPLSSCPASPWTTITTTQALPGNERLPTSPVSTLRNTFHGTLNQTLSRRIPVRHRNLHFLPAASQPGAWLASPPRAAPALRSG